MSKVKASYPALIVAPVATAIFSLGIFFVALVNGWFGPAEGVGSVFCEGPIPGLIKQPANTWSNLAFMATGLIAAFHLWKGTYSARANNLTRSRFYSIFFCCLVILLGPSSMAMHATTSYVGGFLDMMCMYLVASFMTAYATERFFKLKPWQFILVFVAVLAICVWAFDKNYYVLFDNFGSFIFAFFITVAGVFELLNIYIRKLEHNSRWMFFAIANLLTAFLIWNLSKTDAPFCDPSSLIQGHAIWHILNAVALYGLFRFYVSEHKENYE